MGKGVDQRPGCLKFPPRFHCIHGQSVGDEAQLVLGDLPRVGRRQGVDKEGTKFLQQTADEALLHSQRPSYVWIGGDQWNFHTVKMAASAGEELRVEISTKFHREQLVHDLTDAGFELTQLWTDDDADFDLALARRV